MAQASSWWQEVVNQLPNSLFLEFKSQSRTFKYLSRKQSSSSRYLLLGLIAAMTIIFSDRKLFLATSIGVVTMWLVYRLQSGNWQPYWSNLQRLLTGANRQLAVAVISGGFATLCSYLAIAIGADTQSSWITLGILLQSLGTLAILGILVWQILAQQTKPDQPKLDQMVADLTDADPLKRLIAVRYLTSSVKQFDSTNKIWIADYFRLMLNQEQELIVRDAILEGLRLLENYPQLGEATAPFSMPVVKRHEVKAEVQGSRGAEVHRGKGTRGQGDKGTR
ncbi:hypothetical protein IQ264_23915 [Phormidium sp. LEGE 05292]|uniref:hypothetical protein n=1 Tax=[Phormidium] sp. LEGE 05292 TaxID=767427 RepID=UPI00187FC2BB|nr:hypothetical protein [Phormidium sp. LEGE 05292]MBE9228469.1 hypothetical protein [Phormidium sp. LEGE 05292]